MSNPAREVLDLFSAAAGGWSLGFHRAGFRTIAACEYVDWRRKLYQQNNPGVRIYDDVRTLTADKLIRDFGRLPGIVVGSPPCQDVSPANTKGKGVDGDRSGLYFEAIRIIGEVRPRWCALENSANLRTRGADAVLAALEALGYACWSFVVRAGDIGANHERPRSWLIGCDVEQLHAHADSEGKLWSSLYEKVGELPTVADNPFYSPRLGHEGGRARRHRPHGDGAASAAGGNAGGTDGEFSAARLGAAQDEGPHDEFGGRLRPDTDDQRGHLFSATGVVAGDRQVGLCAADRLDAEGWRADWSLDDLAAHIQLDDGLSAWLADARIAVGGPRGTSAASLVVEAFGDAVVPQIPEAIGRAILRVEAALKAVGGARFGAQAPQGQAPVADRSAPRPERVQRGRTEQ